MDYKLLNYISDISKTRDKTFVKTEVMKIYDISNLKPTVFPWLTNNEIPIHMTDKTPDITNIFSQINVNMNRFRNIFQFSMPPYLSSKYHTIDHLNSMENEVNKNYLVISCAYIIHIEYLGVSYLNELNLFDQFNSKKDKSKSPTVKMSKNISQETLEVIDELKLLWKGIHIKPPSKDDLCSTASEFLLERCILMQLPWKPMLLNQWLAAAFSQVLSFERGLLEFKHWPINEKDFPIIKSMLDLIRQVKERIMLGFAILNDEINLYPSYNITYPAYIMDIVVLPSIPVLQFIIHNDTQNLVENLKQNLWTETKESTNMSYMSLDSYYIDSALATLHHSFIYNFPMWTQSNIKYAFPVAPDSVLTIVQRLQNNKRDVPHFSKPVFDIPTKPLSLEENSLYKIMETNIKSAKLSDEDKINITIQTIKNHVVEKLKNITAEDIDKKFSVSFMKKKASEIFDPKKSDNVHVAIRQALMYNEAYELLIGSEKESSVDSHLISLQLYNLEQEQLVRLVNTCAILFKASIVVKNIKNVISITLEDINSQLESVHKKIKIQSRESFFDSFPEDWKIPISIIKKDPIASMIHLDINCTNLIQRIQKIVYHLCMNNFDIEYNYDTHSNLALIQYVLSSLVSEFYKDCKIDETNLIYSILINSFITHYEIDACKKHEVLIPVKKCMDTKAKTKNKKQNQLRNVISHKIILNVAEPAAYDPICRFVTRHIHIKLSGFAINYHIPGVKNYKSFAETLKLMLYYFKDCTEIIKTYHRIKLNYYEVVIVTSIYKKKYDFLMVLLRCIAVFDNTPHPGQSLLDNPLLGELYFINALNEQFVVIFEIEFENSFTSDVRFEQELRMLIDRYLSDTSVIGQHAAFVFNRNMFDENLNEYLKNKLREQYLLYEKFKQYRKRLNKTSKIFKYSHILPFTVIFQTIQEATNYYLKGDLKAIDNMISIFKDKRVETLDSMFKGMRVDTEDSKVENTCRQCGKPESVRKLITCEHCIKDLYPDVHYFCGRRCQEIRWKAEHSSEHLEFELGLSKFNE